MAKDVRARLAGGAFFRCDESGTRLLSGAEDLAHVLGLGAEALGQGLGAVLGAQDPSGYTELFAAGEDRSGGAWLRYDHPAKGRRWLRARREPFPGRGPSPAAGQHAGGVLVFVRDETLLHESLEKLAAARSQEVENSARLQAAILVEGPRVQVEGIEYHTATIPSKLVDGDFLDVLSLRPGSADFLLGDVMGKGMAAAILGATIKFGFLRELARVLHGGACLPDPAAVCSGAEAAVAPLLMEKGGFATLTYARFDNATRSFSFVDCGHTSIIQHSRRTGRSWRIKGSNMPLGFTERQAFRSFTFPVDPGDVILLFTDGLSECTSRWRQALGEERIMHLVGTYADLPPAELTARIMKIGFDFSASGFNDDVSLVCIRGGEGEGAAEDSRSVGLEFGQGGLSCVGEASAALGADLDRWAPRLGAEERSRIVLAFHEALANIAVHAASAKGERHGGPCPARWLRRGDLLVLEVEYEGPDYDWTRRPESPIADYAASGYGRLIMEEAMDSLLVARGHGGAKRLVMCRRLGGEG